jgi:1,4-alpha-glucan branching enzyme
MSEAIHISQFTFHVDAPEWKTVQVKVTFNEKK